MHSAVLNNNTFNTQRKSLSNKMAKSPQRQAGGGEDDTISPIKKRLNAVTARPENQFCCDCGDKKPTWASIIVPPPGVTEDEKSNPMGAFCCFHCSGAHRRLGVHICFVRSITLDAWKEKEVLAMEIGGNDRVNEAFEANLRQSSKSSAGVEKPDPKSDLEVRDRFIKAKYRERLFFDAMKYETGDVISNQDALQDGGGSPKFDRNIFVGMSTENFFSPSKMELFASSEEPEPTANRPMSLPCIPDMGQMSPEEFSLKSSKVDIEDILLSDDPEGGSSAANRNTIGKQMSGNNDDEDNEYHIPLRDDRTQATEQSASASSKMSTSNHTASSRSRRSSGSKSPTPEGRSSSRPRVRRTRSSHDMSESKPGQGPDLPRDPNRKSRQSKSPTRSSGSGHRSSSRSRLSQERDSSSGGMRRSASGPSLEGEAASSQNSRVRRVSSGLSLGKASGMRRSGSGHSIDNISEMRRSASGHSIEKSNKISEMRRSTSGHGLDEGISARSGRRSGSGNTLARSGGGSGNALSSVSSHSKSRRSADSLNASLHRKGRKSVEPSCGNRNATFDAVGNTSPTENPLLAGFDEQQSNGSSMLSGRRKMVVPSKYALEEYETTLEKPGCPSVSGADGDAGRNENVASAATPSRPRSARRISDPLSSRSSNESKSQSRSSRSGAVGQPQCGSTTPPRRAIQRVASLSRLGARNCSLGSSSTHGPKSRLIRKQAAAANEAANADKMLLLFAASQQATEKVTEKVVHQECETEVTMLSPDASAPASTRELSEEARKAIADLKGVLQ